MTYLVVLREEEMAVLKLIGSAMIAISEGRPTPPAPTDEQHATLLELFQRIEEM